MRSSLKVAGVGVSQHMEEHLLPSLALVSGLKLQKLASRDALRRKELSSRYGVGVVEDWRSLLDDPEIDALIVAGPPKLNQEVVVESMKVGKPVFSEKPICSDLSTVMQLAKLEQETNGLVQVGYNFRFSTIWENIFSMRATHGEVRELSIDFHTNKPREPMWGLETTFESFLYAIAIHPLEMMSSILRPNETLHFWRRSTPDGGESCLLVGSDEYVVTTLKMSNLSPAFKFCLEALFEDGTRAQVDHSSPGVVSWTTDCFQDHQVGKPSGLWRKVQFSSNKKEPLRDREGSGYQAQFTEFLESLRGEKSSVAPISTSMRPHRWIDRMVKEVAEVENDKLL